jgi:phage host-nuclease inhibitor protein Gam
MEETKMSDVVEEIKGATEEELREVIEQWLESTRTDGMKIGATYIAAAVMGKIQKHLSKPCKTSLRDYERCIADIKKMLAVQLTRQNDLEEAQEEATDDGTAE